MSIYVLVNNSNKVIKKVDGDDEFRSGTPPTLKKGKGIKWLSHVEEVKPVFNNKTEELNELVTVTETTYTEGWVKVPLSAAARQELIDVEIANTNGMLVPYLEDLIIAIVEAKNFNQLVIPIEILKVVNRRRKLRGLPDVA